jgi:dolichyl-phosphate-mannose--protein O-mannosyl transferase
MGAFVLLTIGLFAFFYPIYTAQVIPLHDWQQRMWFPSWV